MLSIDRSVITDTGSALLNSGDPVNITSIKTGSGTYTSAEDIKSRTALKSTQYSYDPTSVQVDGVNRTVSGILTNYDPDTSQAIVTSDYTITEVGLFATVNSVEVLFAIGVSYDGTEVPAFTGQNKSEIIVDWVMALSGTAQVTVSSPGAYATAADLNTHIDNEVFSASGVHGIRAVDDGGVVKIQVDDNGWVDVNGGHVIEDEAGTTYPYRSKLKFYNSTIVDNSTDNTTEIHVEGAAIMVTPPTVVVGTYTYNGQPQGPTITWAAGMEDYCIVTNATKTDAGSYTLTIALKNSAKMFWSDFTTADKTYSYSIAKANQTLTLSESSVTITPNNNPVNVTVTGAEGTLSATTSSGAICAVYVSGTTVTLTGTEGNNGSATITVNAASTSNYNAASTTISVTATWIPNGATVTPTNDIQTWLHCGNEWNKNYTTISQVLSDTSTLSTLISSNNATDYLVRSTSWASSVCGDSNAMSYIGLNNYCSNTLLANSTWLSAIANSSYIESVMNVKVPTMTSNTAPSGEVIFDSQYRDTHQTYYGYYAFDNNYNSTSRPYSCWSSTLAPTDVATGGQYIGYMFPNARNIKCFKWYPDPGQGAPSGATINVNLEYSNDGTNWTSLQSFSLDSVVTYNIKSYVNNQSHKYWRLYETSANFRNRLGTLELQFYGRINV